MSLKPLPPESAFDPFADLALDEDREALQDALLSGQKLPVRPQSMVSADDEQRARQSWVTHNGNVAAVARDTALAPRVITRLASENDWPLYGDGDSQTEKSTRTRLRRLHDKLEMQMLDLLDSLGVETKEQTDIVEKGLKSEYVASLSQRSGAFKQVFDSYCKVGAMIAPEVFDIGAVDVNGVRARSGGVAGVDRDLADFVTRVSVGIADEISRRDRGELARAEADIVEAEVLG